jgi:spore maturation protein CgeB
MTGFSKFAGVDYITIPLAADKIALQPIFDKKFEADISFIGTNLPQKRRYFNEWLFPLGEKYDLKLYGQDWTLPSRLLGYVTKGGQYFNVPVIKSLQKPPLQLGDEAKIYASSKILVNIHEDYQRQYGGDCNERTFKIPFCGGFEISDDVACIRDYFVEGKELVIAKSKQDWFDKIDYYFNRPAEAKKIAAAGRQKVLASHLYKHRAQQMLDLLSN